MTPAIAELERAGVPHRVIEVGEYQGPDRQQNLAADLGVEISAIFKTLVAKLDRKELATAVVPITAELNMKALAAAFGAKRAEMADVREAEAATGYVLGGICPIGQRRQMATYLDESVLDFEKVYVSAGRRGFEIEIAASDLIKVCKASLVQFSR